MNNDSFKSKKIKKYLNDKKVLFKYIENAYINDKKTNDKKLY